MKEQVNVNILMVDDHPENLVALEAILGDMGVNLIRANSGKEALKQVLKNDFALILLDVQMPGMDGFETASLIRERERSRHTPIIFLTAIHQSKKHVFEGYSVGAVDYILKPFDAEILKSKVQVFVELFVKTQESKIQARLVEEANRELEKANNELKTLYDKVKELSESKSQFFASVSHELRTPLSLIKVPVEKWIESDQIGDELRRDLRVANHNAGLLLRRVNDLLDISKLEAGKMPVSFSELDLVPWFRMTASHFDVVAKQRKIDFAATSPDTLIAQVDPEKMQRVFINLLSNAFKFTPNGGKVRCSLAQQNGNFMLSVEDSGPGIPEESRSIIFEPFRQLKAGPETSGTGLGLSIVKDFVELHQGTINVSDSELGGASFEVSVPIQFSSEVAAEDQQYEESQKYLRELIDGFDQPEVKPVTETSADGSLPVVLLVEDHPQMTAYITEILSTDYKVLTASTAEQGIEKARELFPDLIVTDLMLPEKTGEELISEVRRDEKLKSVPILVLTAKAENDLRVRLLKNGAQDYLMKPFSSEELKARVRNQISVKRTRDLLQNELSTTSENLEKLALEMSSRKRELQVALDQLELAHKERTDLYSREQRARQEAEQANRIKDEFLATLSHELRTPLTAMLGWSRMLRSGRLDEESFTRAIETIERNAKVQCQLIEDLLDISRIISGKMRIDTRPIDFVSVVQAAIDSVRPAAEAKNIEIDQEIINGFGLIMGDPDRLQQVVWNILTNAIKFTPKQGRITIKLDNSGSSAVLSITDTGIGINPDFLPFVFERFRQSDNSGTRKQKGLGLGLGIVRHLIELHGGTVQAESEGEGHGSTFIVTLPIPSYANLQPSDSSDDYSEIDSTSSHALLGLNILLVEDQDDARDLLTLILEQHGASVSPAANALEAIEAFRRSKHDVIISDINMPEESGYDLLRKIREYEKTQGRNTPAVALTAFARPEDRDRALSSGFQLHVAKPVEPSELIEVITSLISRNGRIATESR
jgi:signal transduction histidine kinase